MSSNKKKKVFSPYKSIVSKIEEVTKIKRINMRELGSELGVTVSAVSDYSKKDYIPSETMMKWCERRKVSVDWVLNNQSETEINIEETVKVDNLIKAKDTIIADKDEIITLLKDKVTSLEYQLQKKAPRVSKKIG